MFRDHIVRSHRVLRETVYPGLVETSSMNRDGRRVAPVVSISTLQSHHHIAERSAPGQAMSKDNSTDQFDSDGKFWQRVSNAIEKHRTTLATFTVFTVSYTHLTLPTKA